VGGRCKLWNTNGTKRTEKALKAKLRQVFGCIYYHKHFIIHPGKFWSPFPGKLKQPQEQRYPLLSVSAILSCVQTLVWLPGFGIFNVHAIVHRGLYGQRKSVLLVLLVCMQIERKDEKPKRNTDAGSSPRCDRKDCSIFGFIIIILFMYISLCRLMLLVYADWEKGGVCLRVCMYACLMT